MMNKENEMDLLQAIEIIENDIENDQENPTEDEYRCAWQFLVDTGHAWNLQGWYGRTATDLIESGFIQGRITG